MGIDISKDLERLNKKGRRLKSGDVFDVKTAFPATASIAPGIVEDAAATRAYDIAKKKNLKNPFHLTMKEIDAIFSAIDEKYKDSPMQRQRMRTMITVAYGMGLRSSEYTRTKDTGDRYSLKTADVLKNKAIKRQVVVTGKGRTKTGKGQASIPGKDRTVNVSQFVRDEIKAWLLLREKGKNFPIGARYLFPAMQGEAFKGGVNSVMPYSTFQTELKKLGAIAGIEPERMHSHIFRHSYGTHLASLGYPPEVIAAELGHEDVSTTRKYYIHVENEQRSRQIQNAGDPLFRGQQQATSVLPGTSTQVATPQPTTSMYSDVFPSESNMRAVVDASINRWATGSGTINELQNELRQSGVDLTQSEIEVVEKEAQERRLRLIDDRDPRPVTRPEGTFQVSHDDSALREQEAASRAPSAYTGGAPLNKNDIAIDFEKTPDAKRGARLVLKVAADRNISIQRAFYEVVDAFEAAHYQLGDPEARKEFRKEVGKLFPFGLGHPGQKDLIAVGEDWGGTSGKTKPRIFSASGFESQIIAQHLFDEGLLEDIDPPDSNGKRSQLYTAAKLGLFKTAEGKRIPESQIIKTDKKGVESFKTKGVLEKGTFIGNILTRLEKLGGDNRIIGIRRDPAGRSSPVTDDSVKKYPYGYYNPSKDGIALGDDLTGYGVTEEGKRVAASLDLDAEKLIWVNAVASDKQKKFFNDMKIVEREKQKLEGLPDVARNSKAAQQSKKTINHIENKYSLEVENSEGKTIFPYEKLPSPDEGFNPLITDERATAPVVPEEESDIAKKAKERLRKRAERLRLLRSSGKAGVAGLGFTGALAVTTEEAAAAREKELTGKGEPDYFRAMIDQPTDALTGLPFQSLRAMSVTPAGRKLISQLRKGIQEERQPSPSERVAREMYQKRLARDELIGRQFEELELVPSRDERTKRREEALVEVRGGTKSPPTRTPLSFMSDEELLSLTKN